MQISSLSFRRNAHFPAYAGCDQTTGRPQAELVASSRFARLTSAIALRAESLRPVVGPGLAPRSDHDNQRDQPSHDLSHESPAEFPV